jgi:hypothetical protein
MRLLFLASFLFAIISMALAAPMAEPMASDPTASASGDYYYYDYGCEYYYYYDDSVASASPM